MTCLTDIIEHIDDIEDLLQSLIDVAGCCDSGGDPTDGDQYTDSVTDGVGNVPQNVIDAGYATGVSDWTGFGDYKCMVAHLVVDSMEAKLRKLAPHVDSAASVAGGFATIAVIITAIWSGGLSLLVAGLIAATGAVSLLYEAMISGSALVTLANKISTNHDDLACAFYHGDGSQDSVDDLKTEIDALFSAPEAIVLKNTGLEIDAKALYAGRFDQIDTAAALEDLGYDVDDFDCTCLVGEADTLTFDDQDEADMWKKSVGESDAVLATIGGRTCLKYPGGSGWWYVGLDTSELADFFGWSIGEPMKLKDITGKFYFEFTSGTMDDWRAILQYHTGDGTWLTILKADSDDQSKNAWHDFPAKENEIPDVCHYSTTILRLGVNRNGASTTGKNFYMDELWLHVDKDDC